MIKTQNIHSLTDFQRNSASHIKKLKESGLPEVLTVNGRAELVVQTAEAYQKLLDRLELHESSAVIVTGLQEIREGNYSTPEAVDLRMRSKLGIVDGE